MSREPIPLIRTGGFREAEKLYVLSYEGLRSEKKYFEDLRKSSIFNNNGLIETISLKRPDNRGSDPINVKKLLQEAKSDYNFKKTDEFWLVIDRDNWEEIHKHSFDQLAEDCRKEGNFFLAMSNPCFEIWLILHLKDIQKFSKEEQKKLFENKPVNKSKNYIDQVLGQLQKNNKGYNKRPNPRIFLPLTKVAIKRAKRMDDGKYGYPKNLGTHVYKLVEKLVTKE